MSLAPHFTLEEFTRSATAEAERLDNTPTPEALANLERLAAVMERVRLYLGERPITITSGYRGPQLNAAVGGVANSAHCLGLACDFVCPDFGSPLAICRALEPHMAELGIDQLIYEFGAWVHLGLSAGPPRHMALTIGNGGTRYGFA
jgi:hypothetical protein